MKSYSNGTSAVALLGETIGENLERTVARVGDREAIVACHQGLRYTYAEFDARVDLVAGGLLDLGLEQGDRVGLWSPNYVEWALVQYATAKIGVILVNLNPAYRSHELRYALGQSGCRVVVAAPSFKSSDYQAMLTEVGPELGTLERVVYLWSDGWGRAARVPVRPSPSTGCAGACPSSIPTTPSISSTRAAPPDFRRAPPSRITTS